MTAPTRTTPAVHRDVRYGEGAILRVPELVAELGARRVLLVCGGRSFEASGAARMLPELERVAAVRRWSEFAANPDAADLAQGLALLAEVRPELVLGIGGGSAMDMAKLLCAFAGVADPAELPAAIQAGAPVAPRAEAPRAEASRAEASRAEASRAEAAGAGAAGAGALGAGRPARLVLAPTTSGSGSEATHFAVVYLGAEKFSVAGDALRPDVAILDPALSRTGSPYQRATSGIDAVAQAVESLWAVAATDRSRRWARHALRLLLPAIESHVHQPEGAAARAMAIGSHLAGRAIDISKTTAAHALSYAITKRHGVSHGHAVALTLGEFIEAHADPPAGRLQPGIDPVQHRSSLAEVLHRLGATDGAGARERFRALLERLGLPARLSLVGVHTPADRRALVRVVNAERLGNNPVRFDEEDLAALVDRAG